MLFDLALVIAGFSLIIFLHELGHYVAARWAGVRVLAFAMGFGPALASYRRGIGFQWGSSEREIAAPSEGKIRPGVSPTEYRWNLLPLGGYVKMLGQDDADPSARSEARDSFQSCPPWKRLIIICAGVVMNIITAAVLFVVVFLSGLKTEPPHIGTVLPAMPAAVAVAENAAELGVTKPGLASGDRVLSIDGDAPLSFKDVLVEVAMSARGEPMRFVVARDGVAEPLRFSITPQTDPMSRLLAIGVGPAAGNVLPGPSGDAERDTAVKRVLGRYGLGDVALASELVAVNGQATDSPYALTAAAAKSGGSPVLATFRAPDGSQQEVTLSSRAELDTARFATRVPGRSGSSLVDAEVETEHVAGLIPVLRVESVEPGTAAAKAGLAGGDIFVRLGDTSWPSRSEGIVAIRSHAGMPIEVVVLRGGETLPLGDVPVSKAGTIGFIPGTTEQTSTLLAAWPSSGKFTLIAPGQDGAGRAATKDGIGSSPEVMAEVLRGIAPAAALALPAGSRLLSIAGTPVSNFEQIRAALQAHATSRRVPIEVELPPTVEAPAQKVALTLEFDRAAIARLGNLGWASRVPAELFEMRSFVLKASSPGAALGMGLHETRRVVLQTYITFARLFQGSVKVEHLKGPVGIASAGVQLADRGLIWLLLFMGVISINLAVVNFLPLPIVDGGHAVFIIYEMITGKPVSVAVQNVAAVAGLALIGSLFLIVTYNDIANLIWR